MQRICAEGTEDAERLGKHVYYTYNLTLNSKAPTPIPVAAPVPERPMKCSLPMLLANRDAPTWIGLKLISKIKSNLKPQTYGKPEHVPPCQEEAAHGVAVGAEHGLERDNRRNKVAKNNYRNMYVHETVLFLTNSPTPRTMAMYPTTATTSQVPRRMESEEEEDSEPWSIAVDADIVFVSLSASFTEPGVIRKRERKEER